MTFLPLLMVQSTVSVATLLPQMTDMTLLTRPANPAYTMAQSSSYDRHSNPGPGYDEFANGDAGNFLRIEDVAGRKEYVLADLDGPGAVVRIWSANPAGTVRFYFDGQKQSRLTAKLADLLQGKVQPFADPFAYNAANGTNLYFPFPYKQHLKITVDNTDENKAQSLYYHVGYRTYGASTNVKSFQAEDVKACLPLMKKVARQLLHPNELVSTGLSTSTGKAKLGAGATFSTKLAKAGTVRSLSVKIPFPLVTNIRAMDWGDSYQPHNILRNLLLTISTDGKKTVSAPLGDFFSTAPGINVDEDLPFTVAADGTMTCRLPMPFQKDLQISVQNIGKVEVPFSYKIAVDPHRPAKDSYALHAQWQSYRGQSRPFRNLEFLNVKGNGNWVGSNLQISNPIGAWWGEGDEKVYVDGEKFPSTFGTGTEDYYGYAWSSPNLFHRPYHNQPRADGPGNFGQIQVKRWHIFDPIPYTKSMLFQLELWHWEDAPVTFAWTTFWYAPVNSPGPVPINRSLLPVQEVVANKPVAGALEGENLKSKATGGTLQTQDGFYDLSAGKQLWWTEPKTGDKLTISFPVKVAGKYEVFGNFCQAGDYGVHDLSINGQTPMTIDFFGDAISWKKISLGTFDLPAGTSTLMVECKGKRSNARPGQMFALDYLLLEKK